MSIILGKKTSIATPGTDALTIANLNEVLTLKDDTGAETKLLTAANILHTDISDFDTGVRQNRLDQMAAPTAPVALNSQRLSGVAAATTAGDAATAGAALTAGYIPVIDASGRIVAAANIYRDPTTGNLIVVRDTTPVDISGATLQVVGSVVVSDGAGGAKSTLDSTGRIIPTMPVGLYGQTSTTVAHNTATNVARINIPGSPIMAMFLVQMGVNSASAIKSALYAIGTAYNAESATQLASNIYGGGALTVTANTDTTNRYITINVTHTNTASEAATVHITAMPLMCASAASLTMLV